jgi:hypothetical protein
MPYSAFVWLWVNSGECITLHPNGGPRHLVGFSFKRGFNEVGSVTITLLDTSWTSLHEELLINPDVYFKFGYESSSRISGLYFGRVLRVTPKQFVTAMELTIEIATLESPINGMRISDSHPSTDRNEAFADPAKYVERLIERKAASWGLGNYKPVCVPSKPLPVMDSSDGKEGLVPMRLLQVRQSDLQFIRNVVAPYCVSKDEEFGPYVFYVDHDKFEIYFGPPKIDATPRRLFEFMQQARTEVISFEPETNTAYMMAQKGGVRLAVPFIDLIANSFGYAVSDNESTPNKHTLGDFLPFPKGQTFVKTTEQHPLVITTPVENAVVAKVLSDSQYFRALYGNTRALLTIVGDYDLHILPNNIVTVLVRTPDNEVYFTSGNYIVSEITDEISGGSWRTILQLEKDAVNPDTGIRSLGKKNTAPPPD